MAISFSPSSGINFSGIASGLNTAEIISALLGVESKATKQPLIDKKFLAQKKLETYGTFENALKTLQDKVKSIDTLAEFLAYKATPSNSDVLTASASGDAIAGSYSISVTDLAEAETETHANGFADTDTLTVNDGTAQNLVISYAGVNYNVAIDSSNNTLAGVAAAINADTTLSSKVSAAIVNVAAEGAAASYKIVLTGKDTGFNNTISIDASALSGGTQALGATSQLNAAQDAEFVVNGLTVFRSTNSITDVIPGVTLDLIGPGTTQLTIAKDTETIKENIQEFVEAYNDLNAFIRNQQKYEKDKAKNPLFGEFALTTVRSELPNIIASVQNLSEPSYANLGLIGVEIQSDGSLKIDDDVLDEALSDDPNAVGALFVTGDGTNAGIAQQIDDFIQGFVSGVGENEAVLKSAKDAINSSITQINAQLLRVEERLTRLSDQLNKRYSDLETTLGRLQSQLSYLGQIQY